MTPARMSTSLTSAPVPAPVLDVEPAEPAPKKKRLPRPEERREARVRAAAGGGGDSDSAEPQAAVTGRRVLIGQEVLVYLAEYGQLNADAFNLLGYGNRRGTDSVCPTTRSRLRRKCCIWCVSLGCTTCQAERNFQRSPTSLV